MKINKKVLSKYGFIISMLAYPTALFLVFYVYININSIIMAFQNISIDGIRTFAGWENFSAFFKTFKQSDQIVNTSLINSLKMYFINLVICMPLYIVFSYYLFKRWFGHSVIRLIIMLPAIISSFIMCLLFKKFVEIAVTGIGKAMFDTIMPNLLSDPKYTFGTSLFYMIWISFSTSLIVYPNAMRAIDEDIFHAAAIDGANIRQELFRIVLPLIFPTISTFLILGVAGIFTNAGPIVAFYEFRAPAEVYNMGYYITQQAMTKGTHYYPKLAAIGIVLTVVTVPIVFALKAFLDRINPEAD